MEPVLIAFLGVLGGSGGVAVIYRAFLDAREKRAGKTEDLTERFSIRLEKRLQEMEARTDALEKALDAEQHYVTILCITLARHNIEIPLREHHHLHKETK